jgi:hypothetical protein
MAIRTADFVKKLEQECRIDNYASNQICNCFPAGAMQGMTSLTAIQQALVTIDQQYNHLFAMH